MEKTSRRKLAVGGVGAEPRPGLFWMCAALIALTPLGFSTGFYRIFVFPKFAILLVGSAAVLILLCFALASRSSRYELEALRTKHVLLVSLYVMVVALSTLFGVVPMASLFGSYPNAMGLITRVCFFACFIGLIVSIRGNRERLFITAQVIAVTGLLVAAYAVAQFVGKDPFLPASAYTFKSPSGPVIRVPSTLGHSNYLGNFLLYTTPLTAALAIGSVGRARRLAIASVALSIAAIAFSGTRGAWLGLIAGAITFAALARPMRVIGRSVGIRRKLQGAAIVVSVVLVLVFFIALSPASHNLAVRARSIVTDRFTGSGRTLLWRDSIRVLPEFSLIGCGPEAFSRVFPTHKSVELAIHASQINNESSHDSYLDAAISHGLGGIVLYVATIVSAFSLLFRARARAGDSRLHSLIAGLIASLGGVVVHNVFIYDQIPTGLYFFVFMALAGVASNVTRVKNSAAADNENAPADSTPRRLTFRIATFVALALGVLVLWYLISLGKAEIALKHAFASASAGKFEELVGNGERATQSAEPTGAYDFMFARALSTFLDRVAEKNTAAESRAKAIELGTMHAHDSIARSFTPGSNYLLLAYLALRSGDKEKLMEFASEAVRLDPNYFSAHWLMGEAWLAKGNPEQAVREAKFALKLRPGHNQSLSVLARAQGEEVIVNSRVHGLVVRGRLEVERGRLAKAEEFYSRAIEASGEPCPVCRRELALVYESENKIQKAINEWRAYLRETPDSAVTEQVMSRIRSLERR